MKRMYCVVAVLGLSAVAAAETYKIDPNHSFPTFEVNHLGLSTYRGRFDRASGTISLDPAKKQGSVEATIDVKSVSTGVEKLNQHLMTADFFDAEKFPAITFQSTKMNFEGDALKSVVGDLTMRGVTKPVTLQVNSFACKQHPMYKKPACGADLQTTVKRSDFGISYGIPAVSDEVTLKIQVEAFSGK